MDLIKIGSDGKPLGVPSLAALYDRKSGLMWPTTDISEKPMSWADLKKAAGESRLLGFSDWHLATIDEYETVRDRSRFNPAADLRLNFKPEYYWSSTPLAKAPSGCAWGVHFYCGTSDWGAQDGKFFGRAVRFAGQQLALGAL